MIFAVTVERLFRVMPYSLVRLGNRNFCAVLPNLRVLRNKANAKKAYYGDSMILWEKYIHAVFFDWNKESRY